MSQGKQKQRTRSKRLRHVCIICLQLRFFPVKHSVNGYF